jgi:hypothetical protein
MLLHVAVERLGALAQHAAIADADILIIHPGREGQNQMNGGLLLGIRNRQRSLPDHGGECSVARSGDPEQTEATSECCVGDEAWPFRWAMRGLLY